MHNSCYISLKQPFVRLLFVFFDDYTICMTDVHDKQTRSRNMAAIRNKDTKPEIWLRKRLHAQGFRYRLNTKDLPGKPDIVLPKYKAVIFVHGCFWHMHDCNLFKLPKTRTEWWYEKLSGNRGRDAANREKLASEGWRVLTLWECAIKGRDKMDENELLQTVISWLEAEKTAAIDEAFYQYMIPETGMQL